MLEPKTDLEIFISFYRQYCSKNPSEACLARINITFCKCCEFLSKEGIPENKLPYQFLGNYINKRDEILRKDVAYIEDHTLINMINILNNDYNIADINDHRVLDFIFYMILIDISLESNDFATHNWSSFKNFDCNELEPYFPKYIYKSRVLWENFDKISSWIYQNRHDPNKIKALIELFLIERNTAKDFEP